MKLPQGFLCILQGCLVAFALYLGTPWLIALTICMFIVTLGFTLVTWGST